MKGCVIAYPALQDSRVIFITVEETGPGNNETDRYIIRLKNNLSENSFAFEEKSAKLCDSLDKARDLTRTYSWLPPKQTEKIINTQEELCADRIK